MSPTVPFRLLVFLLLGGLAAQGVGAQPALNWDFTFGGESYEELNGLRVVPDGILMGGSSRSNVQFGTPTDTSWNILLAKASFEGQVLWHRMVGGDRNDRLWNLIPTADGGMLAGGYSFSGISGQKTQANKGGMDVWVIRLDADGNVLWDRTLGGTGRDELFSMLEMPDGTFMLGCHSNSGADGDKTEPSRGGLDFWLIGLDANGYKLWDKTIGGNAEDQFHDLALLPSGHILASGGTVSQRNTGEVGPDFARGAKDYWILEFDPGSKTVVWNHRFGGTSDDFAYSLLVTTTGRIFLGGRSASQVAPPTAINNGKNAPFYGGESDYWLLELDAQGLKMAEWSFGGTGLDDMYFVQENKRGEFCVGGVSDSGISGNKTTPSRGQYDYWVIGLDTLGNTKWQRTIGGGDIDALTKIDLLPNGAFVFGGHSQSSQGFEKSTNGFGVNDFWVVTTFCANTISIDTALLAAQPCSNDPVLLAVQAQQCNDCMITWNNGATGNTIEVPPGSSGTYIVSAIDEYGCVAYDTLVLDLPQPPSLDLGPPEVVLQPGNTLVLGQNPGNWTYQWSTGATSASIVVGTAGTYTVTITDTNGCTAEDAVAVQVRQDVQVYAPTVFAPDLDGLNDYFTLYGNEGVARILLLQVFDRWGELVFRKRDFAHSDDVAGWDGRYREQWADTGVYTWMAEVLLYDGEKIHVEGNITIVR